MSRSMRSAASGRGVQKKGPSTLLKAYLVAYNTLSAIAWLYILVTLTFHLAGYKSVALHAQARSAHTAAAHLASFFSSLPWERLPYVRSAVSSSWSARVPQALRPLVRLMTMAYAAVGPQTTLVQSAALLEVFHAAFGWVRSPLSTVAMQVASRIFMVWGVAEQFESARISPFYASMVLAWSLTEVIRYFFYTFSLLNIEPYVLLWLRYTTFFILYPIGAGSEWLVSYATLPRSSPVPSLSAWARGSVWTPYDYVRGIMLLVWPPSLYVLYTYMMAQRRKALGRGVGRKLGGKPKAH